MDMIDSINSWDQKAPAAIEWNPEMLINDENL